MDVQFPDVPVRTLRYSALIRERGGVGYYPTSATPFVHIDTDRVRAWPRLPRYELALLFPNGRTQHQPAEGGPISKEDVQIAQSRHRELAVRSPSSTISAIAQPARRRSLREPGAGGLRCRLATAHDRTEAGRRAAAGRRGIAERSRRPPPCRRARVVDRPSRLTQPSTDDRAKLAQLAALAGLEPQLVSGPVPAARRGRRWRA
jgi:hypothetical protein